MESFRAPCYLPLVEIMRGYFNDIRYKKQAIFFYSELNRPRLFFKTDLPEYESVAFELPEFEESYDITIQNIINFSRRGIILYLEYHSVCPFIRIGSAHPFFRLRVRGWADPIRTTEEKAWYSVSVYSMIFLVARMHFSSIKNFRLRLQKHFRFSKSSCNSGCSTRTVCVN